MKLSPNRSRLAILLLAFLPFLGSCVGPYSRGRSALFGAGLGAVAGHALSGGDADATILGTAIGAGAGYAVGSRRGSYYAPRPSYGYSGGYSGGYYGGNNCRPRRGWR
ncbi:MAG: glycine zipper 2TM domain-containing protein [Planctomycetota bacterium]